MCWSFFLIKFLLKKAPTQVFFYEICEIFKNAIFYRTPLLAASVFFMGVDCLVELQKSHGKKCKENKLVS